MERKRQIGIQFKGRAEKTHDRKDTEVEIEEDGDFKLSEPEREIKQQAGQQWGCR